MNDIAAATRERNNNSSKEVGMTDLNVLTAYQSSAMLIDQIMDQQQHDWDRKKSLRKKNSSLQIEVSPLWRDELQN